MGPDLSAQGEGGGGVQGAAVGINIGDGDLDRGVVLGGDQAVWEQVWGQDLGQILTSILKRTGCRALAGNVEINEDTLCQSFRLSPSLTNYSATH